MIAIKNLYEGQLPNVKTTLYTVPAATTAVALSFTLVNTSANSETMNLYYKKAASTSRRIIPQNLSLAPGTEHEHDAVLMLGIGDEIEGDASTAAVVDVVISGLERT